MKNIINLTTTNDIANSIFAILPTRANIISKDGTAYTITLYVLTFKHRAEKIKNGEIVLTKTDIIFEHRSLAKVQNYAQTEIAQ